MDDSFIVLLVLMVPGIIFGTITYSINTNKGYGGGFAWGFFLWILGIIIVACRPFNQYNNQQNNMYYQNGMPNNSRQNGYNPYYQNGMPNNSGQNGYNPYYQNGMPNNSGQNGYNPYYQNMYQNNNKLNGYNPYYQKRLQNTNQNNMYNPYYLSAINQNNANSANDTNNSLTENKDSSKKHNK